MARKRTLYESDNARVYLTGASIATKLGRRRFEAGCVPTQDRADRAHAKTDPDGWLVPGGALPNAKPRRYPEPMMVVVRFGRKFKRVGPDTHAETIGDRAAFLAGQGVPIGYVGSVTGSQAARNAETYREVELFAARVGKTARDILRPLTHQAMSVEEARLSREADAILAKARRK